MQKNPGFDKGKTAGMFGLTLYDLASFISLKVFFLYISNLCQPQKVTELRFSQSKGAVS